MTVRDLIDRLEELAQAHGDDREVVVMHQQHYPLQENIKGATVPEEYRPDEVNEDEADPPPREKDDTNKIVLVASGGGCYGNEAAWDTVG